MTSPFVAKLIRGIAVAAPIRADNGYGCCPTCIHRETGECSDCDDADLYEPDLDAVEELLDARARMVA